jgi:hypothetical protein
MNTKPVCQLDAEGYFVGMTEADESPLEPGVWLLPAGAVDVPAPSVSAGFRARWDGGQFVLEAIPAPPPAPVPPALSQFQRDQIRYQRRAAVRDELIAWMAADNISRVRSGEWAVADLTGLMADPALQAANAYMATLSYELAAQAIGQANNPLMTPAIKSAWVAKLQEHFYLVP